MEDEGISIEETNRIRISLGLKPLKMDDEPKKKDDSQANFEAHKAQLEQTRRQQEIAQNIEKAKKERLRNVKLAGKGLGQAEDDEEDALAWVSKIGKKTKKRAASGEKEIAEKRDYTEKDLVGMKIGHSVMDVADVGETILVLKDRVIGEGQGEEEEEQEELVNLDLHSKEQQRKSKKKIKYSALDTHKTILDKYDEEEAESFVIGQQGNVTYKTEQETLVEETRGMVSLDYEKMNIVADYMDEEPNAGDVSIKKKKKKKKSNIRKTRTSDLLVDGEEDLGFSNRTRTLEQDNYIDDDDLQAALARARKAVVKDKDFVKNMIEIAKEAEAEQQEQVGVVFSAASEFALGLEDVAEEDDSEIVVEKEQDEEMKEDQSPPIEDEPEELGQVEEGQGDTITSEPLVAQGMAATLALLNQKGLLEKPSEEQLEREKIQKQRALWLQQMKKGEIDSDTFKRKDQELADRFKNYKPDVKLHYTDEFGRELTPKEAYKQLARKFHGKQAGKHTIEKKLKKVKEELKAKKMASGTFGVDSVFEKAKTAAIVLNVGNKSMVPSETEKALMQGMPPKPHQPQQEQQPKPKEATKVTFGIKRKVETSQDSFKRPKVDL